ncbi:MAG: hypothetical protein GX193_01075 [Clostridiales bacterium]|nr:hypothetical protein [Clostridiales bacterium]
MGALSYLYLTRWKNRLKSLVKSPGQLIVLLIFAGLLIMNILTPRFEKQPLHRDISELYAGIAGVYALMFIMICSNGITRGGSLFSMADVNLLFVSSIPPTRILFYGLIQQLSSSIMVGLFILFQYSWMNLTYGVNYPFILLVLLGYALCVYCGQVTSMVIYANVSSSIRKRRTAKAILWGLCLVFVAYIAYHGFTSSSGLLNGIVSAANSKVVSLFPVAGWLRYAIVGVVEGEPTSAIMGFGAIVIYVAVLAVLISRTGDSYYEDVLQSTERTFQVISARKSGQINEVAPENIKLGKTGINRGFGASVLYYKHRLENRRSRVFIFDTYTIIFLIMNVIFAFFMRKEGGLPAIFSFSTYMLIFVGWLGRWVKELVKHYIYLIPEPPFRKLLYCIRHAVQGMFLEAFILFAIVSIIIDISLPEFILAVLARVSFAMLFLSANIFVERFFSTITVKILAVLIYFLSMIVFAVPGIAVTVILSLTQVVPLPENILILSTLAIINTIVTLIATYASRNMLEYAELNSR